MRDDGGLKPFGRGTSVGGKQRQTCLSYNGNVEARFQCAGCGECNQTTVDESAGRRQAYIEDCQVCCRPNLLHIGYDAGERGFVITAELE